MIRPYIYVFDADTAGPSGGTLTGGANYSNLAIPVQDCDRFVLSRVSGFENVAAKFRLYDAQQFASSSRAIAPPQDLIVMPSYVYPVDSAIRFDLENVSLASRATAGTPNYYSQLCFQGQKHLTSVPDPETPYKWRPMHVIQVLDFTLTTPGRVSPADTVLSPPQTVRYQFSQYDFELHQIRIFRRNLTTNTPADTDMKLVMFDSYNNALMSAPVLDSFLNVGSNLVNSQWPAPTILYPIDSAIRFDIYSLQTTANLPINFQIQMIGIWRQAC
jgi:hypothetical protein